MDSSQVIENTFSKLKDLKELNSTLVLQHYFELTQTYGLLDPKQKSELDNSHKLVNYINRFQIVALSICTLQWRLLKKFGYGTNAFLYGFLPLLPLTYYVYRKQNEVNFVMLQMKDDYMERLEEFYKRDKNPILLNSNFLYEEIYDPDFKNYQIFMRLKMLK